MASPCKSRGRAQQAMPLLLGGLALLSGLVDGSTVPQPPPGFVPGAVCSNVSMSTPAIEMLRGKHIIIQDMDWAPYAMPDKNAPKGWSGLNIELWDKMGAMLGFTYEVHDMGYALEGETWTDQLIRAIGNADLTGSYWSKTPARLNKTTMLQGHVDVSIVLVARVNTAAEARAGTWYKSFISFLDPFTYELWGVLMFVVLASGLVDWLVERMRVKEARLTSSIYEYAAGFLWGGFEYPLTRNSAVYQIIIGVIVLVVISSYTANLAAFMTVASGQTMSVTSMNGAVLDRKTLCGFEDDYLDKVRAFYPRLRWGFMSAFANEAATALVNRECDGLISTQNELQLQQTLPDYCRLKLAEVISPAMGGWVTNRKSPCVSNAFNYAIGKLDSTGELDLIIDKYFPLNPCTVSSTPASRRRVEQADTHIKSSRPQRQSPSATRREPSGRRLSSSSGAATGTSAQSSVPKMGILDFAGLLLVWAGISLWMVFWTYCLRCRRLKKCFVDGVTSSQTDGETKEEDVDVNNDSLVLREILKQLGELRSRSAGDDSCPVPMPVPAVETKVGVTKVGVWPRSMPTSQSEC